MKPWEFLISTLLGAAVVVCALLTILSGQNTQRIEKILNAQQVEINRGQLSNQIGVTILQDMAAASAQSPKLLALLEKSGFKVNFNNSANGEQQVTPPASPQIAP